MGEWWGLSATVVYHWRVVWWSLVQVQRNEHTMNVFAKSLRARRASRMPDERLRAQFAFLGMYVCREAFTTLTGLGFSTLQAARG